MCSGKPTEVHNSAAILTTYSDLFASLCWYTVAIAGIAHNVLHVSGNILDSGDHVTSGLLTNQMTADV